MKNEGNSHILPFRYAHARIRRHIHIYIYKGENVPSQLLAKPLPQNASNAILFDRSGGRSYLLGCDIGSRSVTGTFNKFSTNVTKVKRHTGLSIKDFVQRAETFCNQWRYSSFFAVP